MRDLLKEQLTGTATPLLETKGASLHRPGLGLFDVITVSNLASQRLSWELQGGMGELGIGCLHSFTHSVGGPLWRSLCKGRLYTQSEFESTNRESDTWNPCDGSLPGKSVRGYLDWILEVWGRPTS